jgi:hypothetical protein
LSCISIFDGTTDGACGYGDPDKVGAKSSTRAKKVDSLEGLEVASIACSFAHTIAVGGIDQAGEDGEGGEGAVAAPAAGAAASKKTGDGGALEGLPELRSYEMERKKEVYRGANFFV